LAGQDFGRSEKRRRAGQTGEMKTLFWLAVFGIQLFHAAAKDVPDIAVAEIHRRGDSVEHVTPYAEAADEPLEALAPPADDSHKWYITLIVQKGCAPCELLKSDFARSPHLQAFVDVEDHAKSWAHYNVYSLDDQTQQWRWRKIRLSGTPTIIIQPPRNGSFGNTKTVVWQQSGYSGNPEVLAAKLRAAIVAYAQKVAEKKRTEAREVREGVGQPFTPPEPQDLVPTVDWPRPLRPDPAPAPVPAPDAQPAAPKLDLGTLVSLLIGALFTGNNVALFAIAGVGGFYLIRQIRKARGKPMILSDETVEALAARVFDMLGIDDDDDPPATPTVKSAPKRRVLRRKR
jgi:hypothetical protein